MNLVEWLQRLMTNFGAEWVMWLALRPLVPLARLVERIRAAGREGGHG